jgi:hypothetical protein
VDALDQRRPPCRRISVFIRVYRGCPWPCLSVFIRGCSSVAVRPRPIISRICSHSLASRVFCSVRSSRRRRAQPVQGPPLFATELPKEEFAAAPRRCCERLDGGVAVLQRDRDRVMKFRQSNQFYYLTGLPRRGRSSSSTGVPRAPRCSCCRRTNRWSGRRGRCSPPDPRPRR